MTNTAPAKPTKVPDDSVWDAEQQLWVGPQSEFERGVREGVRNALTFFKDENGHSAIPDCSDADLDQVEETAIAEVLRDDR